MKSETTLFKSKVARRIFILFIICALLPIGGLVGLSFSQVSGQLYDQSQRRLYQASKSVGMEILERILFVEAEMKMIASLYKALSGESVRWSTDTLVDRLELRLNGLALVADTGRYISLFGNIERWPEMSEGGAEHIASGKTLLTGRHSQGAPPRIFMRRLLDPKQPRDGILLAEINPHFIWGVGEHGENTFPPMTELCVLDESGKVLFSSIPTSVSFTDEISTRATQDRAGFFDWSHQDTEYLANYRSAFLKPTFHTPKWTIVLSEARADVFAPMNQFSKTFPYVVLITFCVVLLASVIQIRKSLLPIELLRKGTLKVAEGDFDSRVKIESGDEFEALAKSFNGMSQKIKEKQALLVHAAKLTAFGQMAAGIVHEVNQPMTSIYGLIQIALIEQQTGEGRKRMERIIGGVERLMEILSKFRSFSRRSDLAMAPVLVNQLIDEAHGLLEHQFEMKRINCSIEKTENLPVIWGDSNTLQQVFLNLMVNAMDALENSGKSSARLMIRSYSSNGKVCVDVEDNGAGMSEKVQS